MCFLAYPVAADDVSMSEGRLVGITLLAPRRVPHCLTASVASLKTFIKLMAGGHAPVELTVENPAGGAGKRKCRFRRRFI